jgi:alpha-D-xyloside xylohydrolase
MSSPVDTAIEYRSAGQVLRVEPWGDHSVRVRAARQHILDDVPHALAASPDSPSITPVREDDEHTRRLVVGDLTVELGQDGRLRFLRTSDGRELLAEAGGKDTWPNARTFTHVGGDRHRIEQRFLPYDGEKFYGLGQYQHGRLDQKGLVVDLIQRNSTVSIPFLLSNRGYGLLWNSPAVGRLELAGNGTRWVSDAARQIDYWVTAADTPAALLSQYADATGHAPHFPQWASGLWQSRLRYSTQEELLGVAREYARRQLPLSVIVIDYFHWTHLGDWRFDPAAWPDPKAMIAELDQLGVKAMVSVWPAVSPVGENFDEMLDQNLLVRSESGVPFQHRFPDYGFSDRMLGISYYDATDPRARDYLWNKVKGNYYDHGIKIWWLDACEPEIFPEQYANLAFAAGAGPEVANIYPREHTRGIYEHMAAEGEHEIITLTRSAWAGSQRYGAALWSGDIPATFDSLAAQVRAGLNVGLSGLPWWTTDTGGFHGGDPQSEDYRELMIRWFQYSVFCPLLRMHGHREPRGEFVVGHNGGPNELWSYGPAAEKILTAHLELRTRLAGYIQAQMDHASATGLPPMRPLFVDYPQDAASWEVEDQFLFGPDLLVAPITEAGARSRGVYLPAGSTWCDPVTGASHEGGVTVTAHAPLERIPVFVRAGAAVLDSFR